MTMHDSSPERRNLNVLAVSIILYHLADGKVDGSSLTLNMLNISFGNTLVLQYAIIVFLLWFLFRYWVMNRDGFKKDFVQEIHRTDVVGLYKFFVDNSTVRPDIRIHPGTDGYVFLNTPGNERVLKNFGSFIVFAIACTQLFATKPSLSGYLVPYFLTTYAFYLILFG